MPNKIMLCYVMLYNYTALSGINCTIRLLCLADILKDTQVAIKSDAVTRQQYSTFFESNQCLSCLWRECVAIIRSNNIRTRKEVQKEKKKLINAKHRVFSPEYMQPESRQMSDMRFPTMWYVRPAKP